MLFCQGVLLCTTKLAQTTSQYSTTLYYEACTKQVPVLLCTTKLAQTTSQHYFVLHTACTQYHFVLQSLHKLLPSTTLYYEACAKHFPLLLCDTKLPQRKLLHTASSLTVEAFTHSKLFKQRSFYTQKLLHATSFYAEKLSLTASFHTQQAFTHRTLTHREAFTQSKLLHTKSFTHSKLLQKEVFTQRSFPVHNHNKNCSSKTGSPRQSDEKTILKHFRKIATAKIEKICLDAATPIRATMSSCKWE